MQKFATALLLSAIFVPVPAMFVPVLGQSAVQVAQSFHADLKGVEEVPSISTSGSGRFVADLNPEDGSIAYELRYSGLESAVTQAHIHFSQPATNGAIIVFLCTNLGNGPDGTQSCPEGDGEISGVITADDVLGADDQGLDPGAFDQLLQAIFAGGTYANVHTTGHGSGEIRGQVVPQTPEVVAE
jgi:hypothetical protein